MPPEQPTNNPTEPRPRFQFTLRTLICVVTGCCLLCSAVTWAGEVAVMVLFGVAGLLLFVASVRKRQLDLAVAAVICWLMVGLIAPSGECGSGSYTVPITVTIVDARTKAPIPGAVVQVSVRRPVAGTAETGTDGVAKVRATLRYHTHSVNWPLRDSGTKAWVEFRSRSIRVDAEGYKPFCATLADVMGADVWNYDELPLPPVEIELHPK